MAIIDLLKALQTGPGSRGGKFWIDKKGIVRYGEKPKGTKTRKPEDQSYFKQAKTAFDLHLKQGKAKPQAPAKAQPKVQPKAMPKAKPQEKPKADTSPNVPPKVKKLLEQVNAEMAEYRQKTINETFSAKEKEVQQRQETAKEIFTHAKELALAGNDLETINRVISNEFKSKMGDSFYSRNAEKIAESVGTLHKNNFKQNKPKRPRRTKAEIEAETTGKTASAFGNDPNKKFEFKYKLVELEDLITSNTDTGELNEKYDQKLQPRARKRAASVAQIDKIAQKFVAENVLIDFHQLDRGVPIIGSDKMVESGNGRLMALRRVKQEYPEKWKEYQEKLKEQLSEYGIKSTGRMKLPVLVRERVTDVDRAEFAREANESATLQMSPLEKANKDRERISSELLTKLEVGDDQSMDQALRTAANRSFVTQVLKTIPDNERANLLRGDGSLNKMGIWRIKAAIFAKVFPGIHGERLAETFFESLDGGIKNFENAISATLPKIAQAESLIQSGKRDKSLSLAADLTQVIDVLARLREQNVKVGDYVNQVNMFGDELSSVQKKMLVKFDEVGRSQNRIKEILTGYADIVLNAPAPNQGGLFGDEQITRDDVINAVLRKSVKPDSGKPMRGKLNKLAKKEKDWSKIPQDSIVWALYHHKIHEDME